MSTFNDDLHEAELQSEIARLRAEVERLQHINAELLKQKDGVDKDLFGVVCFERDEALAQVAVLMQTCEELADRIIALDASARILIPQGLPKARALLDRLQLAEQVVEAAKKWAAALTTSTICILGYSSPCPGGEHRHLSPLEQEALMVLAGLVQYGALAAWKEGKA